MVTLAKRATPSQHKLLKIIEGAVLNTADAHQLPRDNKLARSIAKRATGTISSQWKELLAVSAVVAATLPSVKGVDNIVHCRACERRAQLVKRRVRRQYQNDDGTGGSSRFVRRSPLLLLWKELQQTMWYLKRNDPVKYETHRDIFRMIDRLHKESINEEGV